MLQLSGDQLRQLYYSFRRRRGAHFTPLPSAQANFAFVDVFLATVVKVRYRLTIICTNFSI